MATCICNSNRPKIDEEKKKQAYLDSRYEIASEQIDVLGFNGNGYI